MILSVIPRIPRLRFASLGMTANFGDTADKSMPLQKAVHFFGQLSADAFRGCDLLDACLAEAIHGAELLQQQTFPVLTHARAIVENAFFDSFFHEQLVIRVGKPMRLVANALKQSQGRRIHWKSQRQCAAGSINLLVFFCQTDDRQDRASPVAAIRGRRMTAGPFLHRR